MKVSGNGNRNHFELFAALRDSVTNMREGCALRGEIAKFSQFARFSRNYAVRLSDFVRNTIGRFYGACFGKPSQCARGFGKAIVRDKNIVVGVLAMPALVDACLLINTRQNGGKPLQKMRVLVLARALFVAQQRDAHIAP